jgi:DNA modification methylase
MDLKIEHPGITVYNEDCIKVLKTLPNESIDFVLTDPPFNVDLNYTIVKDNLKDEVYRDWCIEWIRELGRVVKEGKVIIIFSGDAKLYWVFDAIMKAGIKYNHIFKWIKMNSQGNLPGTGFLNKVELAFLCSKGDLKKEFMNHKLIGSDYYSVANMTKRSIGSLDHIAQRPVELYAYLIKGFTKEGETVLDPFLGSGTCLQAAMLQKRNFIGMEIDPSYIEKIKIRIDRVQREKFFR